MDDDEEMRILKVRFAVVIALLVFTIGWATVVSFRYPDETAARRWLEHPWEMLPSMISGLACMAVAWWPRREKE